MSDFEPNEIFRFEEVAYDVALIFGMTTDQALARAKRCLNRAMIDLCGHDRRWSWLKTTDFVTTSSGENEYSLNQNVKKIHEVWIKGNNRQKLDRIPTSKFTELVPNEELATGVPRLFDEQGVDSSGAKVMSFYPVPSGEYEIWYRYTRYISPCKDDQKDLRAYWGLPENLLNPLTQKAAAFCMQGTNNSKARELNDEADRLIAEAYAADQARPDTTYRAPMQDEAAMVSTGPMLPPQFGRE